MKRTTLLTLAIATLCTIASCSGGDRKAVTHTAPDSTLIRIAIVPTEECLPIILAADSGIFDSLGIKVALQMYESVDDADTALKGGSADCAVIDLIHALRQSERTPLASITATQGSWKVVANKSARLRSVESLKERTVAISRHSATDMLSDLMLEGTKLAHDDVFRPQVNSIITRSKMLLNSQIDAAVMPEPWATRAMLIDGATCVYDSHKAETEFTALFTTDSLNRKRSADMEKLRKGYDIAAERLNAAKGPQAVKGILVGRLGLEEEVADTLTLPRFNKSKSLNASSIEKAEKWARNYNLLKKKGTNLK